MLHPHSSKAIFTDLPAAIAYADEFVATSNGAAFAGIPATSYEVFSVEGLYGTSYEVAFTAPYAVVAGAVFA